MSAARHDDPLLQIGHNLRRIRRAADVTQTALAASMNTTKHVLSRYENGVVCMDLLRAVQIARALGCDVNALVEGC